MKLDRDLQRHARRDRAKPRPGPARRHAPLRAAPPLTVERFVRQREDVLRFWERARDPERGGFHCWIGPTGDVWKHEHRVLLVQARLLYNYAEGMRAGIGFAAGHAAHLYEFLTTRLATPGGWYASLFEGGLRRPEVLDTYDNLFVVIGMARYARASGRPEVLAEAWRLFRLIEERTVLGDLAQCGVVGVMGAGMHRSADPPSCVGNLDLHYLEALVCLRDAGLAEDLAGRASKMRAFFLAKILDPELMITFDRFEGSYDRPVRGPGASVSLGHSLEWVDFFRCFAGLQLEREVELGILQRAMRHGVQRSGLFEDSFYLTERRCAGGALYWPTVESVKTFNLAWTLYREPYGEICRRVAAAFFRYFVDSDGGVFSEVDRCGVVTKRIKGDMWKCDYHTMRMCVDVIERPGGAFAPRGKARP